MSAQPEDRGAKIRSTREKELARNYVPRLPPDFTTKVVGVSFVPAYPDNLYSLEQHWLNAELVGEPLAAVIVRNPDNAHDPNACEVHVPALGEKGMIGHLTAPLAARLAPELDAGELWQGVVVGVRLDYDHLERPGLEVRLERKQRA